MYRTTAESGGGVAAHRHRGLSLLEVLVSLAVAALFLGYLLPGATNALQRMQLADLEAEAARLAKNHIERLSAWPAKEPVPNSGTVGTLTWNVRQTAIEGARPDAPVPATLRTFRITVMAQAQAAPLVDLTVQRLGTVP